MINKKIFSQEQLENIIGDVMQYESFILILKDDKHKRVMSFIVNNSKVKFISNTEPSMATFVDFPLDIIVSDMDTMEVSRVVYQQFNGFSYNKLIKFAKEYDKVFIIDSTDFYRKYKQYVEEYI